jgi:hypothetical protein
MTNDYLNREWSRKRKRKKLQGTKESINAILFVVYHSCMYAVVQQPKLRGVEGDKKKIKFDRY